MSSSTTLGSCDELASARRSAGWRVSVMGAVWISVGARTVLRLVAVILLAALCLYTLGEERWRLYLIQFFLCKRGNGQGEKKVKIGLLWCWTLKEINRNEVF